MTNSPLTYCYARTQAVLLLLLIFSVSPILAQKQISTTQVLMGTQDVEQVKFDSIQLAFLNNYNHSLPLINTVQFRTETRDLLLRRQEYALRVKPNSLRTVLAKKKLYQSKINEVEIQGRIHYKEALEDRYNFLLDCIFNEKLIDAYEDRKIQLKDKLNILSQTVYDENFDVKDVVDTEDALFNTALTLLQLKEVQTYHNEALQVMDSKNSSPIELNSNDLISPSQIIATTIKKDSIATNLEILFNQSKLETIESEMQLDVAKSKKIIDFVQARYGGKNSVFFDENFSIGVGINIPFFGNAREERSNHYFNKSITESEIIALQNKQKEEEKSVEENFRRTVSKYTIFKNQISNSSVSSLLKTYKGIEGVNPLIVLRLKMSEHNKKIDLLKIERELYENYIKLLTTTNVLTQTPFTNFLSDKNVLITK